MNGARDTKTAEVAVIGGGPAGLVSAIALAAAGIDTLSVAPSPPEDFRTTAFLALGFFVTSLLLSILAGIDRKPRSIIQNSGSAPASTPGVFNASITSRTASSNARFRSRVRSIVTRKASRMSSGISRPTAVAG